MSEQPFAVPGLMEIQSPLSDAIPTITRLPDHKRANTQWKGIEHVGPYTVAGDPPTSAAARAQVLFSKNSDMSRPTYTLDSETVVGRGTVEIDDAATWELIVPPQVLPLLAGVWYWSVRVTAADASVTEIDCGQLLIRP